MGQASSNVSGFPPNRGKELGGGTSTKSYIYSEYAWKQITHLKGFLALKFTQKLYAVIPHVDPIEEKHNFLIQDMLKSLSAQIYRKKKKPKTYEIWYLKDTTLH